MNIVMDYHVGDDGAPIAVFPAGDGTGSWSEVAKGQS